VPVHTDAPIDQLAYERITATLDHQRARLSEIRTNSSILLAATALVASFLGKWSLDKGEGTFSAVALAAFVLGILCGIAPVWPVTQTPDTGLRGIVSRVPLRNVATKLNKGPFWRRGPTVPEILGMEATSAYEQLATALSRLAADNDRIINRRSSWVAACGVLLAAQVLLWVTNGLVAS
jgi:hypothetical protein